MLHTAMQIKIYREEWVGFNMSYMLTTFERYTTCISTFLLKYMSNVIYIIENKKKTCAEMPVIGLQLSYMKTSF